MSQGNFNPNTHVTTIEAAIQDLLGLDSRARAPAPIPHQYIGTAIDNGIVLLTACASSLDGQARMLTFSEVHNWLSLMSAVHRFYFSFLHTATEVALVEILRQRQVSVRSSLQEKGLLELSKIKNGIDDSTLTDPISELERMFKNFRPGFNDYLNAVLDSCEIPKKTKSLWRKFFAAFSVIRNKASHSNPILTESERQKLLNGGLGAMVSQSGELVFNSRMYVQVAGFVLDFLDLLITGSQSRNTVT